MLSMGQGLQNRGQYHLAVAGGYEVVDQWTRLRTHPLPRGGTDFMPHENYIASCICPQTAIST